MSARSSQPAPNVLIEQTPLPGHHQQRTAELAAAVMPQLQTSFVQQQQEQSATGGATAKPTLEEEEGAELRRMFDMSPFDLCRLGKALTRDILDELNAVYRDYGDSLNPKLAAVNPQASIGAQRKEMFAAAGSRSRARLETRLNYLTLVRRRLSEFERVHNEAVAKYGRSPPVGTEDSYLNYLLDESESAGKQQRLACVTEEVLNELTRKRDELSALERKLTSRLVAISNDEKALLWEMEQLS